MPPKREEATIKPNGTGVGLFKDGMTRDEQNRIEHQLAGRVPSTPQTQNKAGKGVTAPTNSAQASPAGSWNQLPGIK